MARIAGIDVGGTFTDLVLVDDATGEVRLAKVPTTASNQAFGVLAALAAATVIEPGNRVEMDAIGNLIVRVLERGSSGLFGLLAVPGEAARSPGEIDAGVATVVAQRTGIRRRGR